MKTEKIDFENGMLWVIDNAVPYTQRSAYYNNAILADYRYTLRSSPFPENADSLQWTSYLQEDPAQLHFWASIVDYLPEELQTRAKQRGLGQCNLNSLFPTSKCRVHTDGPTMNTDFLIYYINPLWDITWGGETLFLDDAGNTLQYCSQYIPGRIIYGTGNIPHLVRPPLLTASQPRWALTLRFNDDGKYNNNR